MYLFFNGTVRNGVRQMLHCSPVKIGIGSAEKYIVKDNGPMTASNLSPDAPDENVI